MYACMYLCMYVCTYVYLFIHYYYQKVILYSYDYSIFSMSDIKISVFFLFLLLYWYEIIPYVNIFSEFICSIVVYNLQCSFYSVYFRAMFVIMEISQ